MTSTVPPRLSILDKPSLSRRLLGGLALTIAFATAVPASAAVLTWSAGGNGNWNVAQNWTDITNPSSHFVPGAVDTARINTTTLQTVTINSNVGSITQLQLGNSINNTTGAVYLTTGGTLTSTTVTTTDQTSGTSRITQDGGVLNSANFNWGRINGANASVTYLMQGGALNVSGSMSVGGIGSTGNGSASFLQSGGQVSANNLAINRGTNAGNNALYEISGGSLSVTGTLTNGIASSSTNTMLRVIGSSGTVNIQGNYSQNSNATLALQIDNGGITKLNLTTGTGTASLAGTLTAGFKGGVALTSGTTFRVVEAEVLTGDFSTKPNAALWTTGTQANVSGTRDAYVLSLASSANQGDLTATGSLAFGATGSGYVSLFDLSINTPVQLLLDVSAGTSTTNDLIAYFIANGISASLYNTGPYDIQLEFTPATATSYFAWDLSSFNATATMSGIALVPEPGTALLTSLGLALLIFRRRRSG